MGVEERAAGTRSGDSVARYFLLATPTLRQGFRRGHSAHRGARAVQNSRPSETKFT